jgi:cytochrome c-type biogenesis protein CcmH/NrfG
LGNIAYQQKNYKDAETFYHKAIKKMPEDPRAYNNLAWLYYEQGTNDLKKAEHLARKALDLAHLIIAPLTWTPWKKFCRPGKKKNH